MGWILIMVCIAQAEAPKAVPAVRRDLKPGTIVATDIDAVALANLDAKPGCFTRYVFIPPNITPQSGFQQVAQVANSVLTRTATRPQPRLLLDEKKGTAVVAIDLEKYASNERQIVEIVELYERLAPRDSWFNTEVIVIGGEVIEVRQDFTAGQSVEIKLASGQWVAATFKSKQGSALLCEYQGRPLTCQTQFVRAIAKPSPTIKRTFAAEPYLGDEGVRLFATTGSAVPMMRLDEFVAFTTDSVNGGLYYELVGVQKTLGDTVAKFAGADAAKKVLRQTEVMRLAEQVHRDERNRLGDKARGIYEIAGEFDQELAKSKAVMNESAVTMRQRAFLFVAGANIAPAEGPQLVAITFDLAEDNTSPKADPQRNLSTYETYNGGEGIIAMPNGMLVYFVFDNQDRIIASVPDTVAWNRVATKARTNAGTVRVSTATCGWCHDQAEKNWGWQPVRNDIARDFERITRILGDRPEIGKHADKFREIQRLAANYAADDIALDNMLNGSRLSYQRCVNLATGAKNSRDVITGLADSYWGYWNDQVWPEDIVRDLGHVMTRKDAQAYLIRNIAPNPDASIPDLFKEDRIIARAKDGESIAPAQYRAVASEVMERHAFRKVEPVLEMKP